MRYILGLCAVLAMGNSAWTSEMGAGEPGYQTPASTVTSPVTQATGTPTLPATSPASAYQAATAQPAATTTSPAPTTMSPGTYTTGTQPAATYLCDTHVEHDVYDQSLSDDGASWIVWDEVVAHVLLFIDARHDDLRHSGPDLYGCAEPDLLSNCRAQVWPVPALAAASHADVHDADLRNPDVHNLGLRGSREHVIHLRNADL